MHFLFSTDSKAQLSNPNVVIVNKNHSQRKLNLDKISYKIAGLLTLFNKIKLKKLEDFDKESLLGLKFKIKQTAFNLQRMKEQILMKKEDPTMANSVRPNGFWSNRHQIFLKRPNVESLYNLTIVFQILIAYKFLSIILGALNIEAEVCF